MRYESASDLREDLERLKRETESARGRLRHPILSAIAAVVIIVGTLGFLFRPTLPAPRVTASTQVTQSARIAWSLAGGMDESERRAASR